MYLQDNDDASPIYQEYNTLSYLGVQAPPWSTSHLGVEMELLSYASSHDVFRCPDDMGSPLLSSMPSAVSTSSHYLGFGSSYRFDYASFSVIAGANGSMEGNYSISSSTKIVHDSDFQQSSNTRLMRDDEFPWFSAQNDPGGAKYGYVPPGSPYGTLYNRWHPLGGSVVFVDGHTKFITSEAAFDATACNPAGKTFNDGFWYSCD
jgi:hypothetical protein